MSPEYKAGEIYWEKDRGVYPTKTHGPAGTRKNPLKMLGPRANEEQIRARKELARIAARAKGKRSKGNSMPLQEAEEIARNLNTEISEKPIETWGKQKPTASVRKEEDSDLYYVVVRFVGAPNKPVYEIHSRADYGRFDPVDLFPGSPML